MSTSRARLASQTPRSWPGMLAGAIAVGGIGLGIVSLLAWGSQGFPALSASFARTTLALVPGQLAATCYLIVGALLASRLPRNPVGWLLLAAGLSVCLILPITLLVDAAHEGFRPAPTSTLVLAWMMSSMGTPVMVGFIAMAGLLFPDGRLISPSWRPVLWLTAAASVLLGLTVGLDPSGLVWFPTLPNPLAAADSVEPLLNALRLVAIVLTLVSLAGLVASFVGRYRGGDAVTQAQLRWVVFAIGIQVAAAVPFILVRYAITVSDAAGELAVAIAEIGSMALPVAAAVAITRYHLFGIDRLINRTLVYVSLIGVLGGLYAASVMLFQRVLLALTGQVSDVPMLIAVFLVAGAVTPVRKWLEGVVDRWAHPSTPETETDVPSGGATTERDGRAYDERERQGARDPSAVGVVASEASPPSSDMGTGTPLGPLADPELLRVASSVLALRRLEDRLAAPVAEVATAPFTALAVDADGRAPCPMVGERVGVSTCLGCPHLRAILTAPPTIHCGFQAGPTVPSVSE